MTIHTELCFGPSLGKEGSSLGVIKAASSTHCYVRNQTALLSPTLYKNRDMKVTTL